MPAKRKSLTGRHQPNPWVAAQNAAQQSPKPARISAIVRKAVEVGFAETARPSALAALRRYCGPETPRVHRAVLALSGGDLGELNARVDEANADYRDVLFCTEYPDEATDGTEKQKQAAVRRMADRYRRLGLKVPKPE